MSELQKIATDPLLGWKPPVDSPFKGMEGFASSFKPQSPGFDLGAILPDGLRQVYAQLPHLRAPDLLAGAAVGGAGGAAIGALRGPTEEKSRFRRALEHALLGAGVGAAGASVVGDRARRYLSNTLEPHGYSGEQVDQVWPKSFKQLWQGAVLDEPTWERRNDSTQGSLARRELLRRQVGVHTTNSREDWFQRNPDNTLSWNEQRPDRLTQLRQLIEGGDPAALHGNQGELVAHLNALSHETTAPIDLGMLSGIMGGQEVPYRVNPNGTVDARVLDRWDVTLDPKELETLRTAIRSGDIFDPAWRSQHEMSPEVATYLRLPTSNAARVKALAARWLMDKWVTDENPWISQKLKFLPTGQGEHAIQPLRHNETPWGEPWTQNEKAGSVESTLEDWQAVPVKVAARVKLGFENPISQTQQPLGGPNPLTAMLVHGALGAGLGHLAGWGAEKFLGGVLPEDMLEEGRGRKAGTVLGALLGAAPAAYWASINLRNQPQAGHGLNAVSSGWPFRPQDQGGQLPESLTGFDKQSNRFAGLDVPDIEIEEKTAAFDAGDSGALFFPSIPVDAFNRAVWNDTAHPGSAQNNPFGTKSPWGDNNQPLGTPPPVAAAVTGVVAGTGAALNQTHVSPWEVAMTAGLAAGKGYLGGLVLGKTVGALAGLSPKAQKGLQQLGLWSGMLSGAVNSLFGSEVH